MEPTRERKGGWGRWGWAAAVGVAAASCLFAAALWLLRTEAGAAWVLAHLPGVQASGVRGALLGDLDVQHLEIALPRGGMLTIDDASWRGLRHERASAWRPPW